MTMPDWQSLGYKHIWMPYAQMQTTPLPYPVARTQGSHIYLEDGHALIDGTASWWTMCHGYQHPHIVEAVQKQAQSMMHVMFASFNHEPALTLARRLAAITPDGLEHVFFSDSGSTAVEVAMKMATQFWKNQGIASKERFLCFEQGYHGDTMGAMSLCDPNKGMHASFRGYMPEQFCVPIPLDEYSFAEFDSLLGEVKGRLAGVIIEPLLQGAGGMKLYSADILAEIYRITKKNGLLFIADEVATGFGRLGSMFACEEAGITPDILCLGKALTGGAATMGATLAVDEVYEGFLSDKLHHALMHGPTYMANPMACAAANASLDLFEQEDRLTQIETIEQQLLTALQPCSTLEHVQDVRVKGAVGVVQYDASAYDMFVLRARAVEMGVWLRPFGNVIYITPPFTISTDELASLTSATYELLKDPT